MMGTARTIGIALLATVLLAGSAATATAAGPDDPAVPKGAEELVYARRFTLEQPFTYTWCKEQPEIREGWILVVRVDREMARPRQVCVPVLYVNGIPAQLMNVGYLSGHLVVFVPGKPDLRKALVYFGSTELPERVDAAHGRKELAAAREAGVRPFPKKIVDQALERGGTETLGVPDAHRLFQALADLIDRYAPDEHDVAEGLRL